MTSLKKGNFEGVQVTSILTVSTEVLEIVLSYVRSPMNLILLKNTNKQLHNNHILHKAILSLGVGIYRAERASGDPCAEKWPQCWCAAADGAEEGGQLCRGGDTGV